MTPHTHNKHPEFFVDCFTHKNSRNEDAVGHQVLVLITSKGGKEETLRFAWQTARDAANWLFDKYSDAANDVQFRIIIAWSKLVRERQGHIIKIWGYRKDMEQIAINKTHQEYIAQSGYWDIPLPGWEKDVF